MTQTASPEVDVRPIEVVETENLTDTDKPDGGNKDGLRHIVRPADNRDPIFRIATNNPTAQEIIDTARLRGLEVIALCGHKFIPKNNPAGRDTCDTCIGMASAIKAGG